MQVALCEVQWAQPLHAWSGWPKALVKGEMASFSRDKKGRKWDRIEGLVSLWTGGRKGSLGEGCFFLSYMIQPAGSFPCLSSPHHLLLPHPYKLLTQPYSFCHSLHCLPGSRQQAKLSSPSPFPELHGTAICQPRFSLAQHVALSP